MGRRSGDLDPGVLLYLARELDYDTERLERLGDAESGLVGLSGNSADLRTLLVRRNAGDEHAALAIDSYCTRLRMQIGAYAPTVRAEACVGAEHLGVTIDATRNNTNAPIVSLDGASVTVRVLETDEDIMIARHARAVPAEKAT